MFIGDGAKLVQDAFQLAKEKSPCIIFIDEIDAIGTKRFDRCEENQEFRSTYSLSLLFFCIGKGLVLVSIIAVLQPCNVFGLLIAVK